MSEMLFAMVHMSIYALKKRTTMCRCLICLEEFADGDELKTHLGMV